jgi:hypothetical protein
MLKIIQHDVWGLEESVVASALPKSLAMTKEEFDLIQSRVAALKACQDWNSPQDEQVAKDIRRAKKLAMAPNASGHDCYLKGVIVQALITYPGYWTPQFQRYHFADIVSSQSKMHSLHNWDLQKKMDELGDEVDPACVEAVCALHRTWVQLSNNPETKGSPTELLAYRRMMNMLPQGFLLTMRITTNYLQLKNIHNQRAFHKLEEWQVFDQWSQSLPQWKFLFDKEERV